MMKEIMETKKALQEKQINLVHTVAETEKLNAALMKATLNGGTGTTRLSRRADASAKKEEILKVEIANAKQKLADAETELAEIAERGAAQEEAWETFEAKELDEYFARIDRDLGIQKTRKTRAERRKEKKEMDMNRYEAKCLKEAEKASEPEQKPVETPAEQIPEENEVEKLISNLRYRRGAAMKAWKEAIRAEFATRGTDCHEEAEEALAYQSDELAHVDSLLETVKFLNDGNPMPIGSCPNGYMYAVTPSTAKRERAYYTDKIVPLTKWEKKMAGVVVAQNRGMLFSSNRGIKGDFVVPRIRFINWIIVGEQSRKLIPTDTEDAKIAWVGNGPHEIKDVVGDGAGIHFLCHENGRFATDLWFKTALGLYGLKGMLMPGLAGDVGCEVVDYWGVKRKITMGNTILINSSMVKGINAYDSLEDLLAHSEMWGLHELKAQWQSGDHAPAGKRPMGTQVVATNIQATEEEIETLLKPECLKIWSYKFREAAWLQQCSINTSRGRALIARPDLIEHELVMAQLDEQAGNRFLKLAQGKFMANGEYLKIFPDRKVYSLVYVHGKDINEAAKLAEKASGMHGQVRTNPSFGKRYYACEEGVKVLKYKEDVQHDECGAYIEVMLVRYPHGAPSETIIVKMYLDDTVPHDVCIIPLPVAGEDGTIPASLLLCLRLQGADFDGDAVTAFKEKVWLEAQKRNAGKPYMVIPVNTESTEKDKTLVTDETWAKFCEMKVASLSNQVGLIATHLKYLLSQCADRLRDPDEDLDVIIQSIVDAAIAMGNDIDEFKHGKAELKMALFQLLRYDNTVERLTSPYYKRYAGKYKELDDLKKAMYDSKTGLEKTPGSGTLDRFAAAVERLMKQCGLQIVQECTKASDGLDRHYFTVHPVGWKAKKVDLFSGKGEGSVKANLPAELEEVYKDQILGLKGRSEKDMGLTAKDLFTVLYRDHSADLKSVNFGEDKDSTMKALAKVNAKYALAKVAIVAWTRAMKKAKDNIDLTAEEALKVFTTLLVQHNPKNRSAIEVMTEAGMFRDKDGRVYEKSVYDAMRKFNFFLDLCGDGLLFLGAVENTLPKAPNVKQKLNLQTPSLDKALKMARKELAFVEDLVSVLSLEGVTAVVDKVNTLCPPEEPEYDASNDIIPDEPEDVRFSFGLEEGYAPEYPDDIQ